MSYDINNVKIHDSWCWNKYMLNFNNRITYNYICSGILNNFNKLTRYSNGNKYGDEYILSDIDLDVCAKNVYIVYSLDYDKTIQLEDEAFAQCGHPDKFVMGKDSKISPWDSNVIFDCYNLFSKCDEFSHWFYFRLDKDPIGYRDFSNIDLYKEIINSKIIYPKCVIKIPIEDFLMDYEIDLNNFQIQGYTEIDFNTAYDNLGYYHNFDQSVYFEFNEPRCKINPFCNLKIYETYKYGDFVGKLINIDFINETVELKSKKRVSKNKCSYEEVTKKKISDVGKLILYNNIGVLELNDSFVELLGEELLKFKNENTELYVDMFGFKKIEDLNDNERLTIVQQLKEY